MQNNDEFKYPDDFMDDEAATPKPVSPISRLPRYDGISVVGIVYFFMVLFSVLFWQGKIPESWVTGGNAVFKNGNWFSLVSSLFLHSDIGHLLSNTPMLVIFGYILHGYFGFLVFPWLCILVGAITNFLTILTMSSQSSLIGASGMVYAMVAMWLVIYLRFEITYPLRIRLMRAAAFTLVVMIPTTYQKNVSYAAHGIGYTMGIISGLLLIQFLTPQTADQP